MLPSMLDASEFFSQCIRMTKCLDYDYGILQHYVALYIFGNSHADFLQSFYYPGAV